MYLKSIRAFGFKSFADKIDLELEKGITAVVGPNGSGKSNIVDAVRWVLGEQSVKSLRGSDTMSDVIFSGSKSREGYNRAYVTLSFDNTDHYLNSEFNEVEVKRVIYKTGENEYYLNNSKVRLKDITDLFMDTGAGNDSFNIISQGSVSDIINSKPEARRTIFEDAAGVLKYKKRKEISLKKLEKTKENLSKIKLVVDELEKSVTPLKEQSETAKKYLNYIDELKNIEIALIAEDISSIHKDYQKIKIEKEHLEKALANITTANNEDNTKLEKLKLENLKIDEQISTKNNYYLKLTETLASLEAEKLVTLERQKYEAKENNIKEELIKLKEAQLALEKEYNTEKNNGSNIENDIKKKKVEKDELDNKIITIKVKMNSLNAKINEETRKILFEENQIEILKDNINNNVKIPNAVKSILNNIRLNGVHDTIGNLLDVEDRYTNAIETSLGSASNFLVVENEFTSKECINYLKDNKLGRATFFPLNIIKPKNINLDDLRKIENIEGFIGIASNLVNYDKKYDNIIKNQLGNVIVAKDIDALNNISKALEYRYKTVSLDGEVLYPGGSITGGSLKLANNTLNDKTRLKNLEESLIIKKTDLVEEQKNLKSLEEELIALENSETKLSKELIELNEIRNSKEKKLRDLEEELHKKKEEISGNEEIGNNTLDKKLLTIMGEITEASTQKEILNSELDKLKKQKSDLALEINELENRYRKVNSEYTHLSNELKEKEIKISRYDVKLDNLLLTLSENYSITYEFASANYELDIPEDIARSKVEAIKKEIAKLGNVNTGAISEYERISERYEFLIKQSQDLEESSAELINIIDEMDKIMIDKFTTTFDLISKEFNQVFKNLFKGGKGNLRLTNPEDILNTGIEIEAEPPGKKLNSIALLSGGEKTLTAIAVLFAILNVKPSPFCILDEIEAALDEANVDTFGKYLQSKKEKSQFILITHKKRTMEYADVLYGITMQESGVSKIVSVNLEEL